MARNPTYNNIMSVFIDDGLKSLPLDSQLSVLHIVGDPVGGIRNHVGAVLTYLTNMGAEVHFAYSSRASDKKFLSDMEQFYVLGIKLLPLVIVKRPAIRDIFNIIFLLRYIKRNNIHIVHGHGAKGGLYARICSIFTSSKSVYTPHGGVAHNMFGSMIGPIYRFVERMLNHCTDFFLFESLYTCESFKQIIGKINAGYSVNPNGVDINKIKTLSACFDRNCLRGGEISGINLAIFAMLREQKGQKYAIEAVNTLKQSNFACKLHLFGDGPDCENLQALVKQLGLEGSIFFYGDVPNVFPYMAQVDIVLIPSEFESFGYVALEALALSKRVIASNVGGLMETVYKGPGCMLVEPFSSAAIADAVKIVMDQQLTEDYVAHLQNYTLKSMLSNVGKIYSRLYRS